MSKYIVGGGTQNVWSGSSYHTHVTTGATTAQFQLPDGWPKIRPGETIEIPENGTWQLTDMEIHTQPVDITTWQSSMKQVTTGQIVIKGEILWVGDREPTWKKIERAREESLLEAPDEMKQALRDLYALDAELPEGKELTVEIHDENEEGKRFTCRVEDAPEPGIDPRVTAMFNQPTQNDSPGLGGLVGRMDKAQIWKALFLANTGYLIGVLVGHFAW